jgi:hypothetical protein
MEPDVATQITPGMDQLPEPVLVHIIGRVQICDAVALSQTCVRLRGLALHVAGVSCAVAAGLTGELSSHACIARAPLVCK